jgi:N utilization substance protein B
VTSKNASAPETLKAAARKLAQLEKERAAKLSGRERRARTIARLAAVQALYQMELAGAGVETVIQEFSDHRFDADLEGEPLAEADQAYFAEIVRGVVAHQSALDSAIIARLAEGWKLDRIDATVRAILRSGAFELAHMPDTPHEVVIDEYVELAKAFFDPSEAKFVNAALDGIARDARA